MELVSGDNFKFSHFERVIIKGVANVDYGSQVKAAEKWHISHPTLIRAINGEPVAPMTTVKLIGVLLAYGAQNVSDVTMTQWRRNANLLGAIIYPDVWPDGCPDD